MTDINTVRALCQDSPIPRTVIITVSGGSLVLNLEIYPILEDSLTLEGSDLPEYDVDYESGTITFDEAPIDQELTFRYKSVILTDATLQGMLDLNSDEIRLAAADCLDMIASSEALIQKKMRILDYQTDGPAVASSLRDAAKRLRDLVFSAEYEEPALEVAEMVYDRASFKERVRKDRFRG